MTTTVAMAELVRVHRQRQRIEEVVAAGNGAAGFDHDEVRGGIGWHHQRTRSLVALWLLCLERPRVGGKLLAITASPTRQSFRRLLRHPAPSPGKIAEEVPRVPRRNEESRIYHWHARTGTFPP